ncbi:MAG TPA: hypothetical protein VFO67_16030 [Gemmatimonadales bacterium]|nr:hypothetical protein [Gemmatimonadales bacterium]
MTRLELAGKRVALERNGEIVPRSRFASERLAEGERRKHQDGGDEQQAEQNPYEALDDSHSNMIGLPRV